MRIACPKCGRAGTCQDEFAGKSIRCRKCDARFVIALASADPVEKALPWFGTLLPWWVIQAVVPPALAVLAIVTPLLGPGFIDDPLHVFYVLFLWLGLAVLYLALLPVMEASTKSRWLAGIVVILVAGALVFHFYQSTPLAIAATTDAFFYEAGYAVLPGGARIDCAPIFDHAESDAGNFETDLCRFDFEAVPVRSRQPALVTNIKITVTDYKAVQPLEVQFRTQVAHLLSEFYYVAIDREPKSYRAEYVFQPQEGLLSGGDSPPPLYDGDDTQSEHGSHGTQREHDSPLTTQAKIGTVVLMRERPTAFVVRVNAVTPGIYTMSCTIHLSSGRRRQSIVLFEDKEFAFFPANVGLANDR